MVKRFVPVLVLVCAGLFVLAPPAAAQQTVNFQLGYFALRGADARVDGDVLLANQNFLRFDLSDFNGAIVGGEWLIPIGRFFEAGAGVSFYRRTAPSVYADFVDQAGFEIEQDLRLRLVPFAFTFRALPLGQDAPIQPYIGGGLNVISWRYSEFGDFIDFAAGGEIFTDRFVASGSATGPVILGGVRFAGNSFTAGGELRYHRADAELDEQFFGPRLDLGGWSTLFTVGVRFGR